MRLSGLLRTGPEANIPEGKPKRKEIVSELSENILDRIVDVKRDEVRALAGRASELSSRAKDAPPARGFAAALRHPSHVRLLAEVKRRSPSAGEIRPGADPVEVARAYQEGGAAALSVLTDRQFFGGELPFLVRVREAVDLPVLRKDFVIDPLQVHEARAAGADAVLLIVRILSGAQLAELHGLAHELGMDALVEVHTAEEMERALAAGCTLAGVNNRDLATFVTDLDLSIRLASGIGDKVTLVAESGIRTAADVDRLGAAGFDAILVGESLMRQPELRAAAAALTGRPRQPRGGG
ncbi:MAG TPA: indole-3-glycerol phosphate synthase TrpC [Longimicrobium sp.]|nr:indole-3-glycerol phosphate synthase TrpC [Longimicrobium sp.]